MLFMKIIRHLPIILQVLNEKHTFVKDGSSHDFFDLGFVALQHCGFDFCGAARFGSNDDGVYRAMCRTVKAGKIRSIGISNFYTEKSVSHFINEFDIAPSVIQNENHLKYQNNSLRDWAAKRGIFIESYYPFGGLNRRLQYRLLNLNIIFKSGSLYKKYVFISPLPFTSMSMEFP